MSRISSRPAARNLFLAAALFIAVVAAVPLFLHAGLLNTRGGGDSPFLLQRLHQLRTALGDGHFPVRWMPDANYGYGYPFYNYYAPLSIYVAAAFRVLGASYVLAVKAAQLAGFVVAAWGMFTLGRRWLGNSWAGLLAAAAYTLAPFHMVNVYVRGDSLAEFWAMAFYPLVVLGLDRLMKAALDGQHDGARAIRVGLAVLAIVYAALILSHNISALIFTPFVLLYLLFVLWDQRRSAPARPDAGDAAGRATHEPSARPLYGRQLAWLALAFLLALALAAWFWLPALAESSLAQLEPVTEGYFHYSNHFRDSNLVQRTFLFDYDTVDGRAFSMGLVQALGILLGAVGLLIFGRRPPAAVTSGRRLFIVSGLLLATFMITSLSLWLWDNLPLLSFSQFPWRFLSIQAFFGALATAGLALLPGRRLLVPAAIGLMLVAALAGLQLDYLKISDGDVTADRLAEYEWYSGNIGTTVSAEYLPQSMQPRPQTSQWLNAGQRPTAQLLQGEALALEPVDLRAASQRWRIVSGAEGATVRVPTMAWPGWHATVDGDAVEMENPGGSGLITIRVPPGEHEVELELGRTPVRLAAEIVSIVALLALGWLVVSGIRFRRAGRRALIAAAGLGLLLVAFWAWPEKYSEPNSLNWDFAQMAYLHQADEGIEFDNGARLISYQYNAEEATAGETLRVTLEWAEGASGSAHLELATPAANRSPRAPVFAGQRQSIQSGAVTYDLAIPQNVPAGAVVPRLTVEGARPLTPSGLTRGDLFLRPVLLRDSVEPAAAGLALLDARAVGATLRDDRVLDVRVQWLTRKPLNDNYNYSLRIVDGNGVEVAQQDDQPGFGFLPSSDWPTGQWIDDWLGLSWSQESRAAAGDGPFDLVARLYDVSSGDVVLTRLLGELALQEGGLSLTPNEPVFDVPEQARPLAVAFGPLASGGAVGLAGYEMRHENNRLKLTLYWSAESPMGEDLHHFVHLEDGDGAIVAQHDGMPRNNSYPASQWVAGEIVADEIAIDVAGLASGEYTIHVGLYHLRDGEPIRAAVGDAGQLSVKDNRLQLPETILVP